MSVDRTTVSGGRIPPHNLEAERALLGTMLLSNEVQIEITGRLTSDDFFRGAHQTIFDAMASLSVGGVKFDVLTLADKLESANSLAAVGGYDYLVELSASAPATTYWERYVEIVGRLSTYRKLITAGTGIVALGYDAPEDESESVAIAEKSLFEVTNKRVSNSFRPLKDELWNAYERLNTLATTKDHILGVATGFGDFDKLTSGLRPGELIILAARPAVGKTALALNMAVGAARKGNAVAVFSLEMPVDDLTQRILCAEAQINLESVRGNRMTGSDWQRITDAIDVMSGYNIVIDDSSSLNITELRAKARRQMRNCEGKGLIIVDYLQLMQPAKRNTESRQVEIAEISRGLKILAKDLKVPIIALSQLSRDVEKRKGGKPVLSDLRESGAIEQDADIVMFLDRNTMAGDDDPDRPSQGMAELIIAKHRNGPVGVVKLAFRSMYTRFEGVDHHHNNSNVVSDGGPQY